MLCLAATQVGVAVLLRQAAKLGVEIERVLLQVVDHVERTRPLVDAVDHVAGDLQAVEMVLGGEDS